MSANQEAQSAQNADMREAGRALADELWPIGWPERLLRISYAKREASVAKQRYHDEMRRAREAGASISEIAKAAGISRTAVYKQLGKKEG